MVGKVRQYNTLRGFGFILKNFREQVFFHVSEWKGDVAPKAGMQVNFDIIPSGKAGHTEQAANVTPVAEVKVDAMTVVELLSAADGGTN